MSLIVSPNGQVSVTVPANESIAVYTQGQAQVSRVLGFPNYPNQTALLGTVTNGQTVFGPYAGGATIIVESVSGQPVLYEVGTNPVVQQWRLNSQVQVTPAVIADGGSMAFGVGDILTGLVTATPTTNRSIQLPTGAAMEAASYWLTDDSFDWSLITLAGFALTVTAGASGHTVVGAMATAATSGSAARFRTRKTDTNTFVTYRLS